MHQTYKKKGQQAYEHTWTNNQYECIHNAYIQNIEKKAKKTSV